MKFCPNCNNILFPRNKKLYCKACEMEIELEDSSQEDFKIIKTIKHDEKEISPIIVKDLSTREKISASDRKAFEEYFETTEEPGS